MEVVYLIGAGATQGAVHLKGIPQGVLMQDLMAGISEELHNLPIEPDSSVGRLINDVMDDKADIEPLITFLDESSSHDHRQFAGQLRTIFHRILKKHLDDLLDDSGKPPSDLYAALLDMHGVPNNDEALRGILTLNYDTLIEHAAQELNLSLDLGFELTGQPDDDANARLRLLKLHGSFDWSSSWPIATGSPPTEPSWLPPGIQKGKGNYPYNLIWGAARDLVNCDLIRIIGCNLGFNDWDLVSMLFAARYTNATRESPMVIEVIGRLGTAERVKNQLPYLQVRSMYEAPDIGPQMVGELLQMPPISFVELTEDQLADLRKLSGGISNPFLTWIKAKAEYMYLELGSLDTSHERFKAILESPT